MIFLRNIIYFVFSLIVIYIIIKIIPKQTHGTEKDDYEKRLMDNIIKVEDYDSIKKYSNILCIGSRGSRNTVKCIVMDSKFIYCTSLVTWKFVDNKHVIINNVTIPITHTRNTTFQCWPSHQTTDMITHVSENEFNDYLKEMSKRISSRNK